MNLNEKLSGVFTAIVTPFNKEGEIDWPAYDSLVERQINAGVSGLVPVGTTGESATMCEQEKDAVIKRTVEIAAGRVFVLAGTGSNNTAHAVDAARRAENLGADGCLVVAPYYNRPTQGGLRAHFSTVADAIKIPVILYNVPGRCGVEIAPETTAWLSENHQNIVGIKEAGGKPEVVTQLRALCGHDFVIHSGDDGLTLAFLALGANGVTSVVSNYAPKIMVDLIKAWNDGNSSRALKLHDKLYPLAGAMFSEASPSPVKAALSDLGLIFESVRLPLVPLSDMGRENMELVLKSFQEENVA